MRGRRRQKKERGGERDTLLAKALNSLEKIMLAQLILAKTLSSHERLNSLNFRTEDLDS
jgi:hypothetical protein